MIDLKFLRHLGSMLCCTLALTLFGAMALAQNDQGFPTAAVAKIPDSVAHNFQLHILKSGFDELRLGYTIAQSWQKLKSIDLKDSAMVITEQDIESYHWADHSISLYPLASAVLVNAFGTEYVSIQLEEHAFVVSLNGEPLYGGIFLLSISPMAIKYPVIYVDTSDRSKVRLYIRPQHSLTYPGNYRNKTIEHEGVRALFLNLGKLSERASEEKFSDMHR